MSYSYTDREIETAKCLFCSEIAKFASMKCFCYTVPHTNVVRLHLEKYYNMAHASILNPSLKESARYM